MGTPARRRAHARGWLSSDCRGFARARDSSDEAAIAAIREWADVARQVLMAPTGQHAAFALSSYILEVTKLGARRLRIVFDQHIGAASMKKFESTYDRITRESKAEGKAEGELTGGAKVLLRLLRRRFRTVPKTIAARLTAASAVDLDRWTDRVLDAETIAEVFADATVRTEGRRGS